MENFKGYEYVKRGLEVALTGNHSVLLIGADVDSMKQLADAFSRMAEGSGASSMITIIPSCACGNYTHPHKECTCTPYEVMRYYNKHGDIQADIVLEVPLYDSELPTKRRGETNKAILARVGGVCRQGAKSLTKDAEEILKMAILELGISAKSYDVIIGVSDTIADMDNDCKILSHHISEAIGYRVLDRNIMA